MALRGITPPEGKILIHIRQRCYNPNAHSYLNYGGRGITVCDAWRFGEDGISGYQCFIRDMGMRPTPKHTLDRIDNDGNYEPGNCRWTTKTVQSINRRLPKNNKSGYRGVCRRRNKWVAQIGIGGRTIRLGVFSNLEDAAKAYESAFDKYHRPLLTT